MAKKSPQKKVAAKPAPSKSKPPKVEIMQDARGRTIYTHKFIKSSDGGFTTEKTPLIKKDIRGKWKMSEKQKEVCVECKKDRNKLYKQKTYRLRAIEDGELTKRKANKFKSEIKKIESKISKINNRVYKCGKTYAELKSEKAFWHRRFKYLQKHFMQVDDKTKLSLMSEMSSIADIETTIRKALHEPVIEKERQIQAHFDREAGEICKDYPAWQATTAVMDFIRSGVYLTIDINGEEFSTSDVIAIKWELDELFLIISVTTEKKGSGTPFVTVCLNDRERHISVYETH